MPEPISDEDLAPVRKWAERGDFDNPHGAPSTVDIEEIIARLDAVTAERDALLKVIRSEHRPVPSQFTPYDCRCGRVNCRYLKATAALTDQQENR